jgi:hypothetical protein
MLFNELSYLHPNPPQNVRASTEVRPTRLAIPAVEPVGASVAPTRRMRHLGREEDADGGGVEIEGAVIRGRGLIGCVLGPTNGTARQFAHPSQGVNPTTWTYQLCSVRPREAVNANVIPGRDVVCGFAVLKCPLFLRSLDDAKISDAWSAARCSACANKTGYGHS